jgi:hypothetical protein
MDNTRIRDIENYQGDAEGFINLNNAVWSKAIDDEFKYQKLRIFLDTSEKIFNALLKYEADSRNTYVKVGKIVGHEYGLAGIKLAKKLEQVTEEHGKQLKKAVQNKIYEESVRWPRNVKNRKDSEYEKVYVRIRDSILNSFDIGRVANE